ncbi:MAG: glycosyltransferase family 9 protein [Pseudonocardia sp.]|nr:glycosyltransferase family 9 protein [Pseudonocardia sp.]
MLFALRALGLGDLLVAVPALRALRAAFPDHRRLLATPPWLHPLCELVGGWEPVPMADLASTPPVLPALDIAVNLHGNGPRSASLLDSMRPRHRIGHHRPGWPGPDWVEGLPERHRWCRLLIAHGITADELDLRLHRPYRVAAPEGAVLVHPGAADVSKRWPLSRFAEVAAAYSAAGHHVVITGSAAERELAERLVELTGPGPEILAGRTRLPRLAALVGSARLVVSGDTGIAHLAYAYGTPTVTLLSHADLRRWMPPPGGPHRTLYGDGGQDESLVDGPKPALLDITAYDVLTAGAELGIPASGGAEATSALLAPSWS